MPALFPRMIRGALWAPLAVLLLHAVAAPIFGHEPIVDPIMHFLGGVAVAFCVRRCAVIAAGYVGALTPMGLDLLALGLTCAAAMVWEFGEYLGDVFLGSTTQTTAAMTLRDLFLGFDGAMCFLLAHAVARSRKR